MIVILNAVMGVLQESKAEKALDALKSLSTLFGLIPLSANLYLKGLGLILVPVLIMELSKACGLIRHHH